jgi:hypothetical protein
MTHKRVLAGRLDRDRDRDRCHCPPWIPGDEISSLHHDEMKLYF